mmetsp:Transcript_16846/g.31904  ORF Transcript_16846/g.31904 Transcript_16846/m.31904 type:complete len:267 (+) Transcript_16846:111-911(+)
MSSLPYKQTTNVERRTWNKSEYEAKAKARLATTETDTNLQVLPSKRQKISPILPVAESDSSNNDPHKEEKEEFRNAEVGAEGPLNSKRAFLKARRGKVDLDSKIGTTEIILPDAVATSTSNTSNSVTDGVKKNVNGIGWHCRVCDCFLKDSLTYLDHINGRKHQRALGFSMRTARSSTDEVVNKLDQLAKEHSNCYELNHGEESKSNKFEDIVRKKDEDIEQRKAERKKRREERKSKINDQGTELSEDESSDIAKLMGFKSFGHVS